MWPVCQRQVAVGRPFIAVARVALETLYQSSVAAPNAINHRQQQAHIYMGPRTHHVASPAVQSLLEVHGSRQALSTGLQAVPLVQAAVQ